LVLKIEKPLDLNMGLRKSKSKKTKPSYAKMI
jgi:hypothetical protein